MPRIAFLTYNSVGDPPVRDGWHENADRKALVLQNTRGHRWAVIESAGPTRPDGYDRDDSQHVGAVTSQIDTLWAELVRDIEIFDHIVIYVGATGSQRFIELARGIDPERLTFVGCRCDIELKMAAVERAGLSGAMRLPCECGGRRTLGGMLESYLHGPDISEILEFILTHSHP